MKKTMIFAIMLSVLSLAAAAQQIDTTSTGNVQKISGESLNYPSLDFRNLLSGRFLGLDIIENDGELISLSKSDLSTYSAFTGSISGAGRLGTDNILCIIDDVPVALSQYMLDPLQVESVSYVSSVLDKSKYGPLASDGALVIKTISGGFNRKIKTTASLDFGLSSMDRTGEWVNGVQYATLNNLARINAGYTALYDEAALKGFSAGNPDDLKYPNVDYRSLMIKSAKPLARLNVSTQGGTKNIAYALGLGAVTEGGYFKTGSGQDYNRINFNSRVTARIGKYVQAGVAALGSVAFTHSPEIAYNTYRLVPSVAYPLRLGYSKGVLEDVAATTMLYGVSHQFEDNWYAALQTGRAYTTRSISGSVNATLDVDFSFLLKGLKSKTYVNFGVNDMSKVGKADDYIAYYMTTGDPTISEMSSTHKGAKASSKTKEAQSLWQQINFYEDLSWQRSFGRHAVELGAKWYLADSRIATDSFYERQQDLLGRASYSYDGKYNAEFTLDYAGSSMFASSKRYCLMPAAGLSWVLSKEGFLKDSKVVNFLKLRAQAGQTGAAYNVMGEAKNLWDSRYTATSGITYGPATNGRWFGDLTRTATYTTMTRIANSNLEWEKISQADFGVDARFLGCLDVTLQYYMARRSGIVTEMSSEFAGIYGMQETSVYANYNAIKYSGLEASLRYSGSWGDFSFGAGVKAWTSKSTYDCYAGDLYRYPWQQVEGSATDAYRGFVCIGKYETAEQLEYLPKYSSTAGIGDLMYEDLNGDKVIDENDSKVIGNTSPRLRYALDLNFRWRDLDLSIVGTGRAFCDVALTNDYYWNGWGDGNISAFVRDNIGGDYPTLSYVKNTNNFVSSDFWLRDGSYFKIQNAEIGYNIHGKGLSGIGIGGIRVYLRGSNLLTLSSIKDLDPESLSAGVSAAPLYRTFMAGFKLTF